MTDLYCRTIKIVALLRADASRTDCKTRTSTSSVTTFTGESISIVGGAESGVNRVCSNHSNNKTANNARQSFGGYKLSDIGSKAGEPDYLLQFLDPRTVTEDIQRQGFAPLEGMK